MDTLRLCDVLDKHLEGKTYMVGEEYTIADMICFTWFQQLRVGYPVITSVIFSFFVHLYYNEMIYYTIILMHNLVAIIFFKYLYNINFLLFTLCFFHKKYLIWYIYHDKYKHSSGIAANEFLTISQFKNANAWADRLLERPAVKRGIKVCDYVSGKPKPWLDE